MKIFLTLIILLLGINNAFAREYIKIYIIKGNNILYINDSKYENIEIKKDKDTETWYDGSDLYINGNAEISFKDRNFKIVTKEKEVFVDNNKTIDLNTLINKDKAINGAFINEFE